MNGIEHGGHVMLQHVPSDEIVRKSAADHQGQQQNHYKSEHDCPFHLIPPFPEGVQSGTPHCGPS